MQFYGFVKCFPELTDGQISKLVGSTKGTVSLIRKRSYWNFSNLKPRDPVILSLCTQESFQKLSKKLKEEWKEKKKAKIRRKKNFAVKRKFNRLIQNLLEIPIWTICQLNGNYAKN